MITKFCKECNKMRSSKKFCKDACASCYERNRRNSKQLQLFTCTKCGPISTKSLHNGLCSSCYAADYRLKNTTIYVCGSCNKEKSILNNQICRGCETQNWRAKNPGKNASYTNRRRASKKHATPKWSDLKKIEEIYALCPKGLTVDHIVPLNNQDVCGLHIPCNLQYLSKTENSKKNNSFDGTLDNNGWRGNARG